MFKTIALVVVAVIAAVLLYAGTRPDTFRVERALSIKAPPEKIFPLINDLHGFASWSPWDKLDPAMKKTYRGPAAGKGAVSEWDGNSKVGAGSIEIAESSPSSKVTMKLDMLKPFESHNIVNFTLEPKGDSTTVTWEMQGPLPYLAKLMHVFFNMDSMVGKDFETGLINLKAIAEKS